MRVLVLCVVIKIVTASSNIDQSQYPNDENQIRRFQFSYNLPFIPKTTQYYQNRFYNGLSIGPLYPQSNAFIYNSRSIVPYLMKRVNNVYTNEELRRILPYIIGRNINSFVFTKIPNMLINSKRILNRFLLKELIYNLQNSNVHINEIRNIIIKLLQGKGNDDFINTYIKKHESGLIKFTTNKTKESGSYQEVLQNSTDLPLNVIKIENKSKQIQNLAQSKSKNNIEVPGQHNQDNSTIIIKTFHVNVGGNVSNLIPKSIINNNEDKAMSNATLINSSSKINISTNISKEIANKGKTQTRQNNSFNKNKENQGIQSLSSQSDHSKFSDKDSIILNFIKKKYTEHNNQRALDYVLPNDRYNIDSKKHFQPKNYNDFKKEMPDQDKIVKYNLKKNLGYHNWHQISQGTDDFAKTDYNNESTNRKQALDNISSRTQNKVYQTEKFKKLDNHRRHVENSLKTGNQDIKDNTKNLLSNRTSTIYQNNKRQYGVPLKFVIEDLSESGIPYYLQETTGPGIPNNKDKESSSRVMVKWKLHSGKRSDQKDYHTKKHRGDEESMEVKNINDLYKITNLQGTQTNLFIQATKPMEITSTRRKTVKETETFTFGDQSELDQKNHYTYYNTKPNLWPKNMHKLFFQKDYDSPPPVKKVILTDHETSDQIKFTDNNGKSNLMYVILNNLSLSNDKNCKNNVSNKKRRVNKHITYFKSVKDQSDLSHGKEPTLIFEKEYDQYKDNKGYKAKNKICSDCKENDNTSRFQNLEDLLNNVHSTTFNENMKMKGKNIQNKNPAWSQIAGVTSYRNKKYRQNEAFAGYKDIKKESVHLIKRRAAIEEQDSTKETSKIMTNKDKVIANILAPEDVKNDKKLLPYWLPSDAEEVYEILKQPVKDGTINDSLDLEMPLKEEVDKIVQLKKEFGSQNLEEIINLKVNTVGIGKATNIIDKLVPSLYDVYLKNFITKILNRLRQKLSNYEVTQQKNEIKNLDIHEIRKVNSVLGIFESVRDVFNKQDDESLYELLVSLLRFNKQSDEDFDEEVKVIMDSVSRSSIYEVLKYYLVPEPTIDAVRNFLKQQEMYPQFIYYKVLEDILPNISIIIINALAITADKHDDIHKNEETMEKLVKILIILYKVMKDLDIPETTQRFIIEESILDIVRNFANAYIKNYEENVYVQIKKQLQDALYNNINV